MRLMYDHQVFEIQEYGGVSRYFHEIIERNTENYEAQIPLLHSRNRYVGRIRGLDADRVNRRRLYESFLPGLQFRGKERVFKARNRIFPFLDAQRANREWTLKAMRESDFDLFHPTYYDPYFLEALNGRPYVVTVHDFLHEVYPEFFDPRDPTPVNKKLLIAGAAAVIAVSECTKRDITKFCGVDPSRIDVVYHGSSFEAGFAAEGSTSGIHLPVTYLLYVGARHNYKNFQFLAEAFSEVHRRHPGLYLLCAGRPFSAREQRFFSNLGIEKQVISMAADDALLRKMYAGARGFVMPSLYEGFGIPILEAFACGCPAAVSTASSLPEVAGGAAALFDPKDFDGLIAALLALLEDEEYRRVLIEKGKRRLELFSWNKAAEETFKVYVKATA